MLRDSTVQPSSCVRAEIPLASKTRENRFMGFLYFPLWVWGSVITSTTITADYEYAARTISLGSPPRNWVLGSSGIEGGSSSSTAKGNSEREAFFRQQIEDCGLQTAE